MKNIQLLSVVFSLFMVIGLISGGPGLAYAGVDDNREDSMDESTEEESTEEESTEEESTEEESTEEEYDRDTSREDHHDSKQNMRAMMDRFCEMSPADQEAFLEKYPMDSDHKDKMDSDHKAMVTEYCALDESGRDAHFEKHHDTMKNKVSDHKDRMTDYKDSTKQLKRATMDRYCEMSTADQEAFLNNYPMGSDHKAMMTEYCALDESGRDAHFEKHGGSMKDKISDHKESMTDKISDHKSHKVLKASALTDEQKEEIKAMHIEFKNFKHSWKTSSAALDNEEVQNQFKEKAKNFSMAWLSPRHQIAAGIDSQMVECRDGFSLVMKTSNGHPICVKESTAEKLIERGIAFSAI